MFGKQGQRIVNADNSVETLERFMNDRAFAIAGVLGCARPAREPEVS